ncbi:MAG TPA: hypothetical protein VFT69_06975 [Pseudolabrys sp.]|jgi:hypothetical protein|nr:hypothetical protein [Pseudolabrys sp.]
MLPNSALLPIILFIALILAVSLQGLAASGHFPREHRAPTMVVGFGPMILFGSIVVTVLCLAGGILAASRLIPWHIAIIGGGLSILSAPLVLRQFPDRFVDGRTSALCFTAASLVILALLIWIMPDGSTNQL